MAAAALGVGIVVGLLIAEASLRLMGGGAEPLRTRRFLHRITEPYDYYHCYTSNPNGEFAPVPEVWPGQWALYKIKRKLEPIGLSLISQTPWCVAYRISPQLLRDRVYEETPPPGVVRRRSSPPTRPFRRSRCGSKWPKPSRTSRATSCSRR